MTAIPRPGDLSTRNRAQNHIRRFWYRHSSTGGSTVIHKGDTEACRDGPGRRQGHGKVADSTALCNKLRCKACGLGTWVPRRMLISLPARELTSAGKGPQKDEGTWPGDGLRASLLKPHSFLRTPFDSRSCALPPCLHRSHQLRSHLSLGPS